MCSKINLPGGNLHAELLLVSVVDSAPGLGRNTQLVNGRPDVIWEVDMLAAQLKNDHPSPLPVLQSLPPNLRQGGFPPS